MYERCLLYTSEIRAVLAGEKQHTPRKKSTVQPEPPKVNLLVDIPVSYTHLDVYKRQVPPRSPEKKPK